MKQSSQKAFKTSVSEGTVRDALNGLQVLLSQNPAEGLELARNLVSHMRRSGGSIGQKRDLAAILQDFAAQRVKSGYVEGVSQSLEAANITQKLCKNDADLFAAEISGARDIAGQFGIRMKEIAEAQHRAYFSANPRRPGWC